MTIKPQKLDYIAINGISYRDYLTIGERFLIAGANSNEFPAFDYTKQYAYLGIDGDNDLVHTNSVESFFEGGREISVKDLLGSNGEDFAPVLGVECECYWATDSNPKWHRCKILAESEYGLAIKYLEDNNEPSWHDYRPKFRPIKSERDIAIEEMMNELTYVISNEIPVKHFCETLYNSGYRKEQKL